MNFLTWQILIIFFIFTYCSPCNVATLFTFIFKALAEEASEDELPSDVDLNDPYFAEEVKKLGKPACICDFFQLESKEKDDTGWKNC